jgi:(1->4)-alpha-D-glucan 1-alpha-D-glucosylmutase
VWVEKILDPGERLRDWRVSGTVGYEFLNDVAALFIDPAAEAPMTALWERISGDRRSFGEVAMEAKLEQATGTFAPELDRLARELGTQELPGGLDALRHAVASLPVYRTYVEPWSGRVEDEDRRAIGEAGLAPEFAQMLLLEREAPAGFVTRFQQTTPAVMAKGVEDTAFYRYARLIALNDVGGDPSRFGIEIDRFHAGNLERAERFPQNLLTTMTHDAKRSADVRARIGALSWVPEEWSTHVQRWFSATESLRSGGAPDDVERYFIFQTLVGAWPIEPERVTAYMEKALREAKRNTNWVEQNTEWEEAVNRFCTALYTERAFLDDFEPFTRRLAALGDRSAAGQLVLKLTAPGVPDLYQGDELPYRALVDPDNRRPVDWDWRQAMLRRLMGGSPPDAETRKLFLNLRLLGLRARAPASFLTGSYQPLDGGGRACAYLRDDRVLVVVVPRGDVRDGAVETPRGRWRDVLHGDERSFAGTTPLGDIVNQHGIAVFDRV